MTTEYALIRAATDQALVNEIGLVVDKWHEAGSWWFQVRFSNDSEEAFSDGQCLTSDDHSWLESCQELASA